MDIFYAFDENYAPFAGISIFSLLESNRKAPRIRLFAVVDSVCEENLRRLKTMVADFGRELVIVDISTLRAPIRALGLPPYRGANAANARLFFTHFLPSDVTRLLYLDCDTLVRASLEPLFTFCMKGAAVAAVPDALSVHYKRMLGFSAQECYFNSGVLLFDVMAWKQQKVAERIEKHATTVRSAYCFPDQDLLNTALRGMIAPLPMCYNAQPHHRVFSDKDFAAVYPPHNHNTEAEWQAARKTPVILHTYRFLGAFPWHEYRLHPDSTPWSEIKARTPWRNQKAPSLPGSALFKIERILYRCLPNRIFLSLFSKATLHIWRKANQALLRQQKK